MSPAEAASRSWAGEQRRQRGELDAAADASSCRPAASSRKRATLALLSVNNSSKRRSNDAAIEAEAAIERQHRAPQHREFAKRMMLGVLLQRLEAPRDIHDLGLRLGERGRFW